MAVDCCTALPRSPAGSKYIENARQALSEQWDFLSDYLGLANAHTNYFITHAYWDRVHPAIAAQLEGKTVDEMKPLFSANEDSPASASEDRAHAGDCQPWSRDTAPSWEPPPSQHPADSELFAPTVWRHCSVQAFVRAARRCCGSGPDWRLSYDDLCRQLGVPVRCESTVKCFMGEKKAHEVEAMAALCDQLASMSNVKHVVDVGSGRGYLPSILALQYGLSVLGIDASASNTDSARRRLGKLGKQWPGLERQQLRLAANSQGLERTDPDLCDETTPSRHAPARHGAGTFVAATERISSSYDLLLCSQKYFSPQHRADLVNCGGNRSLPSMQSTSSPEAASREQPLPQQPSTAPLPLLLTALHACGSLSAHVLRLFASSEAGGEGSTAANVRALCCVSCCYHLLEEEFVANPYGAAGDNPSEPPCFPMSSLLRSKRCALGRTARVLSAQSLDKNFDRDEVRPLYWRALLQVILTDVSGQSGKVWMVGKLARRSSTFVEYARKCLRKLELEPELSDDELAAYEQRHSGCEQKMHAYILLRSVLSEAIEHVVLLDRLCFLAEQDSVKEAYVVRLFDPTISPRCLAIVATRGTSAAIS